MVQGVLHFHDHILFAYAIMKTLIALFFEGEDIYLHIIT